MRSIVLALSAALLACACAKRPAAAPERLLAPLLDERGRVVGNLEAVTTGSGVAFTARVYALPRDGQRWVLRLHAGDGCTGHTFSDAGPTWGPPGSSGPTRLGPLVPDDRGRAALTGQDGALTLAGVANGIAGRPVVLARDDDDAIARACGVLGPPPEEEVKVGGEQPDITDAWEL